MGNYTPNPFMTQPIYDPTRPFATPTHNPTQLDADLISLLTSEGTHSE